MLKEHLRKNLESIINHLFINRLKLKIMLGLALIRKNELRKLNEELKYEKISKKEIEAELKNKLRMLNDHNIVLAAKVKELTPVRDCKGRFTIQK